MNEKNLRHGAFSWGELMTTDQEGAKSFYRNLFGWQTEDMSMEGVNYTVAKIGDDPVGGIMLQPPECREMPPTWGLYVTVENIDATAAKVEELGGQILKAPTDIPEVGRFCVLQDPQGAVLSVISYEKTECDK